MGKKRRHHFVPQVLTRQFSLDRRFVFLYDLRTATIRKISTRDAFVGRDIYSFTNDSGQLDTETIENAISEFESMWSTSLADYIHNNGNPTNSESKEWISSFIAFQYARTPSMWRSMSGMLESLTIQTTKILDRQGTFGKLPPGLLKYGKTLSELIDNGVVTFDKDNFSKQSGLLALGMVHHVASILSLMNWTMLLAGADSDFIISDNPVSIFDQIAAAKDTPVGLCNPEIEIVLPIHRKVALLMTWRTEPGTRRIGQKGVREINRRSAFFAERFFVAHISSKTLLRQLSAYGGVTAGQKVTVIKHDEGSLIIGDNVIATTRQAKRLYSRFKAVGSAEVQLERIQAAIELSQKLRESDLQLGVFD